MHSSASGNALERLRYALDWIGDAFRFVLNSFEQVGIAFGCFGSDPLLETVPRSADERKARD